MEDAASPSVALEDGGNRLAPAAIVREHEPGAAVIRPRRRWMRRWTPIQSIRIRHRRAGRRRRIDKVPLSMEWMTRQRDSTQHMPGIAGTPIDAGASDVGGGEAPPIVGGGTSRAQRSIADDFAAIDYRQSVQNAARGFTPQPCLQGVPQCRQSWRADRQAVAVLVAPARRGEADIGRMIAGYSQVVAVAAGEFA